jgi:hemoglobin-like flavoprotein
MLGPDIELLTEILLELGGKHVRYGVKPEMFPIMGEVLIATLKEVLKEEVHVAAWKDVYKELSNDMIRAMVQHNK